MMNPLKIEVLNQLSCFLKREI